MRQPVRDYLKRAGVKNSRDFDRRRKKEGNREKGRSRDVELCECVLLFADDKAKMKARCQ